MIRPEPFRATLQSHPATPCDAIASFEVDVDIDDDAAIALRYRLTGDIERLRVPLPTTADRTDGLWRHTCLELFVGATDGAGCVEFNFSPSGAWAAYAFDGYREGMRAAMTPAPMIAVSRTAGTLTVSVEARHPFPEQRLEMFPAGLTAVVETVDGALSYWALAHPVERPDFHHRDGFVLRLGPAGLIALAEAAP